MVAGAVDWTNAPQCGVATRTAGDLTTASTSFVDVTGMSVTITTGAHRCIVTFSGSAKNGTPSANTCFDVDIDGTGQGQTYGLALGGQPNATVYGVAVPVSINFLTAVLSSASHTFKIRWRVDSGTGTLFASAGVTPIIMTVTETAFTA
jgi:hypothetical protein